LPHLVAARSDDADRSVGAERRVAVRHAAGPGNTGEIDGSLRDLGAVLQTQLDVAVVDADHDRLAARSGGAVHDLDRTR
jgi:hypothetical protein